MASRERQTPQRRLRFSLRTMFVLVALLGIAGPLSVRFYFWYYGRKYKDKEFVITGIVTFNGKPLSLAELSFHELGPRERAHGTARDNGEFWVQLTPGRYKVTILSWENPYAKEPRPFNGNLATASVVAEIEKTPQWQARLRDYERRRGKQIVPAKYTSREETPLTIEVTWYGRNQFDFHLHDEDEVP